MPDQPSETDQPLSHPAVGHADSVVAIHMEHEGRMSPHQKGVENMTSWIGRPFLLYLVCTISAVWMGLNLFGPRLGLRVWDKPPYTMLQSLWSFGALLVTIIVLITQNRQAKIQQHHAHLALQLSLLSDQKTAKIIELLEELRRDSPQVRNRVDKEADALKQVVSAEALASDLEKRISDGESQSDQIG